MKTWKIWLASVVVVVIFAFTAVIVALYRNFNTAWTFQRQAAQAALNDSPISRISHHSTFTDVVSEEVFEGKDAFGRSWYSFVSGPPWSTQSVPASQIVSEGRIKNLVQKQHIRLLTVKLGYLKKSQQLSIKAPHNIVWEVYGETQSGKNIYIYFDGQSGKELWKYML